MSDTDTQENGLGDVLSGLVFGLAAAGFYAHTLLPQYELNPLLGDISRVFVPRIVLGLIMVLSAIIAWRGYRALDRETRMERGGVLRLLAGILAVTLVSWMVWFAGLIVGGAIGAAVLARLYGYRNLPVLAVFSVAVPLVIWLGLGWAAEVSMPQGFVWSMLR